MFEALVRVVPVTRQADLRRFIQRVRGIAWRRSCDESKPPSGNTLAVVCEEDTTVGGKVTSSIQGKPRMHDVSGGLGSDLS